MERDEFLAAAAMPGFGNEMDYVLRRSEEAREADKSFSFEAVEQLASTVHDYVMASIIRRWRETGTAPHELTTRVRLMWDGPSEEELEERPRPWWGADDNGGGHIPLDGSFRTKAWKRHDQGGGRT